uniref:uncharacterized protein LOC120326091 n=1 Tax=Styela clava TaxID=7725 RepID=UPI001939A79C|nr:uncharacterized protein LOC120326091 [Styela clava]
MNNKNEVFAATLAEVMQDLLSQGSEMPLHCKPALLVGRQRRRRMELNKRLHCYQQFMYVSVKLLDNLNSGKCPPKYAQNKPVSFSSNDPGIHGHSGNEIVPEENSRQSPYFADVNPKPSIEHHGHVNHLAPKTKNTNFKVTYRKMDIDSVDCIQEAEKTSGQVINISCISDDGRGTGNSDIDLLNKYTKMNWDSSGDVNLESSKPQQCTLNNVIRDKLANNELPKVEDNKNGTSSQNASPVLKRRMISPVLVTKKHCNDTQFKKPVLPLYDVIKNPSLCQKRRLSKLIWHSSPHGKCTSTFSSIAQPSKNSLKVLVTRSKKTKSLPFKSGFPLKECTVLCAKLKL